MLLLVDIANFAQNPAAVSFEVPPRISNALWGAKTSENEFIRGDLMFEKVATIDYRFIGKHSSYSFHNFSHLCLRSLSHFLLNSCLFFSVFSSPTVISFVVVKVSVLFFIKHQDFLKFHYQGRWNWALNMALRNPSSDHFKRLQDRRNLPKCENIGIVELSVMRRIDWYSICGVSFQFII